MNIFHLIDNKIIKYLTFFIFILLFLSFCAFYVIGVYYYYEKTNKERVIQIKEYKEELNKKKLEKKIIDKDDNIYFIQNNIILKLFNKINMENMNKNYMKEGYIYKIIYYGKDKKILSSIELMESS